VVQQSVEHIEPVGLVAVGAGQAARLDEPGVGAHQGQLLGVAAEQQVLHCFWVVQLWVVEAEQHITVLQQVLQRAAVTDVVPELRHDLQPHGRGVLSQFAQQEFTVGAVKHTDASGLGQDVGNQVQLARQWRVAPQQADFGRVSVAQALASLYPADP